MIPCMDVYFWIAMFTFESVPSNLELESTRLLYSQRQPTAPSPRTPMPSCIPQFISPCLLLSLVLASIFFSSKVIFSHENAKIRIINSSTCGTPGKQANRSTWFNPYRFYRDIVLAP